ncbi:MAG: hypothetical protein AB7P04_08925 [Bacteriovoracia bacterium]
MMAGLLINSAFFLSGMAALAYQMIWQRQFLLLYGAGAISNFWVLTLVLLGFGLGSLLVSSYPKNPKRPAATYAALEIGIGLAGIALVHLLSHLPISPRYWPGALALLLPACAMGSTTPFMHHLLQRMSPSGNAGRLAALGYGINTLGAVAGCLTAIFFAVPWLGIQGTVYAAATLSFAAAVCVITSSRTLAHAAPVASSPPVRIRFAIFPPLARYIGFAAAAMALEIIWLRVLGIFNANGSVSFGVGLATLLAGYALGSLALTSGRWRQRPGSTPSPRLRWLCIAAALATLLSAWIAYWTFPRIDARFPSGMAREIIYAIVLMLPPCLVLGAGFPVACHALTEKDTRVPLGTIAGYVNGFGCAAGAVGAALAHFVLVPHLGLAGSLASVGFFLAALAFHPQRDRRIFGGALAAALLACSFAAWNPLYSRVGPLVKSGGVHQSARDSRLKTIHYRAGLTGTVAVRERRVLAGSRPERELTIDDQVVASTVETARVDAKMLAHLPLMLHEGAADAPRLALTVGFGSGGTTRSLIHHGATVHVVEIESEVLATAPLFQGVNNGALTHPRTRVFLNDARDHLQRTSFRYDVISTDVTNLQYKQNGNLYSAEYFALMRARLQPDGVACAWISLMGLDVESLRTLLRTFRSVFPHASLWYFDHLPSSYALLIGTPRPLRLSARRLLEHFHIPEVRADLADIGIEHPYQIPHFLYLADDDYARVAGQGPLHTDDRPILEFSTATTTHFGSREFLVVLDELLAARPVTRPNLFEESPLPEAEAYAKLGRFSRLWARIVRLTSIESGDHRTEARELLRQALLIFPNHRRARMLEEALASVQANEKPDEPEQR